MNLKKIFFGTLIGLSKLYLYYLTVINLINFNEIPIIKKIIAIIFLISIVFYEILVTQNPIKPYKKKIA